MRRALNAAHKLRALEVTPVTHTLRAPLRTAAGEVRALQSVRISLACAGGMSATADAPVWWDAKNAPQVFRALRAAAAWLAGRTPSAARAQLNERALPPVAEWALDCALAKLEAQICGASFALCFAYGAQTARVLQSEYKATRVTLQSNALATARTRETLRREITKLVARGEHSIKVKLHGENWADDFARAQCAREAAGTSVTLRFDANGAWSEAEALQHVDALACIHPALLEQPVASNDLAALGRVCARAKFPVAADEAARTFSGAHRVLEARAANVLVLKPAALGAAARTRELAELAATRDVEVLLSTLFDSALSLHATLQLTAALQARGVLRATSVHGLATGTLLSPPAPEKLCPRAGTLKVSL